MRQYISISTEKREELIDITSQVAAVVESSGTVDGIVAIYAQGGDKCHHDPGELG